MNSSIPEFRHSFLAQSVGLSVSSYRPSDPEPDAVYNSVTKTDFDTDARAGQVDKIDL